jgi:hypothetical protein
MRSADMHGSRDRDDNIGKLDYGRQRGRTRLCVLLGINGTQKHYTLATDASVHSSVGTNSILMFVRNSRPTVDTVEHDHSHASVQMALDMAMQQERARVDDMISHRQP